MTPVGDVMRVDAAGLRGTAPALRQLSAALGGVFSTLTGVLDGAGRCWGGDEFGATFAEGYLPGVQLVRDAFPGLREDVAGVADAVVVVAEKVDAAEGRAQSRLS